jgi:hypothetical protein
MPRKMGCWGNSGFLRPRRLETRCPNETKIQPEFVFCKTLTIKKKNLCCCVFYCCDTEGCQGNEKSTQAGHVTGAGESGIGVLWTELPWFIICLVFFGTCIHRSQPQQGSQTSSPPVPSLYISHEHAGLRFSCVWRTILQASRRRFFGTNRDL